MKKTLLLTSLLLLSGCAASQTSEQNRQTITVSAAASLQDVLGDLEEKYEKEHQNIDIKFNYGASGSLANQIKAGAPVDLFFSAAQDKVDNLVREGEIKKDKQKTVLANHLVVVSEENLTQLTDLKSKTISKIAIGTPETVPAGAYAKEALEKSHLWSLLKDKLVYTKDVRQALTYTETGNVDAAIVYSTDTKNADLVIKDELHQPITYPLALIKENAENQQFYQYLQSETAKKVYESYGFTVK